ncbi:ANK3, partial [Symbiodinium sp. CCMP2456]
MKGLNARPGTWNTNMDKTNEQLRPCLYADTWLKEVEHHFGALVSWVSSAAAKVSEEFRWAFLEQPWVGGAGLAYAALLAAAAYALYVHENVTDRGYRVLGLVEEESRERLQAQLRIATSLALSVADIVSDIYVATAYFRSGLIAFGSVLIAITLGSGVVGFVLHRASWERADDNKNLAFWAQGLNEKGERQPGVKDLLLYMLQIKPLLIAYESLQLGSETVVLVREKVLAQLSESFPSSLLQAYALAVAGAPQEGSVFFLLLSLGLSLGSMADAANKGYRRLCAPTIEPWMNFPVEARSLAFCQRLACWPGAARTSADASVVGPSWAWPFVQWTPPGVASSSPGCQLGFWWRSRCRRRSTSWSSKRPGKISGDPRTCWSCCSAPSRSPGVASSRHCCEASCGCNACCPLAARPALASLAAAAVAFSLATLLTAAVSEILLRCNVTLFPVAQGLRSGPLHLAVRLGSVANVQRIMSAQTCTQDDGWLPVHEAAWCGEREVVRALYSSNEAMDAADEQGRRPLHLAAASGSVDVLRFLAETQVVADSADDKGITAAHMAAEMGHVDALEVLRQAHGVDLQARDALWETAAHKAARGGHAEALRMLSQAKADLGAKGRNGWTPAHYAATFGRVAALEALREAKVELGAKNDSGATPAFLAAGNGRAAALRLLHEAGADLDAARDNGNSPALMAAQNGDPEALQVLREAGADLAAADKDGTTPAQMAAAAGHLEALRLLWE